MAGDTKERILEVALELFAQKGYLGTSMSDIADRLGITKGALYKHYAGKQEILNAVAEKMRRLDYERAVKFEMPESEPQDGDSRTPLEKIGEYAVAQFKYWTEEKFPSDFRKMLTLEQYRDPVFSSLYRDYLSGGPTDYMAAIFGRFTENGETAMQLALEFYGPMFLLYGIYDCADDKSKALQLLTEHIDRFIRRFKAENL